jgi:hypothetical protein
MVYFSTKSLIQILLSVKYSIEDLICNELTL